MSQRNISVYFGNDSLLSLFQGNEEVAAEDTPSVKY